MADADAPGAAAGPSAAAARPSAAAARRGRLLGELSFGASTEARLQTLSVFTFSLYLLLPLIVWCWILMAVLLFNPLTTGLALTYLIFIFFFDSAPVDGSRSPFLRGSGARGSWWRRYCDFFPITLVKTAELPPSGKYVFGYHPHGIISIGAFGCFATYGPQTIDLTLGEQHARTDRRGFDSVFPGINVRLLTLALNFYVPFAREYILSLGCCNASKAAFRRILARGPGNGIVIVPGGAEESLHVEPGAIALVLGKRKGFVREALLAGAQLVPCLAFGESDTYDVRTPEPGSVRERVQKLVYRLTGVGLPFFSGRSIFLKEVRAACASPTAAVPRAMRAGNAERCSPGRPACRSLGGPHHAHRPRRGAHPLCAQTLCGAGGHHAKAQANRRGRRRAARAAARLGPALRELLSRVAAGCGGRAACAVRCCAPRALCGAQGRAVEHPELETNGNIRSDQVATYLGV